MLGFLQCGQRVGGFAGLADRHNNGALFNNWIAVAEFTGVIPIRIDLAKLLHQVRSDHARVQRGALTHKRDTTRGGQHFGVLQHAAKHNLPTARVNAALQASAQRAGLLVNFLQHEVLKITQLNFSQIKFKFLHLRVNRNVINGRSAETVARKFGHRVISKRESLRSVRNNRA